MCCGEAMTELIPGTSDGAAEKHVPVYTMDGNKVTVTIGATTKYWINRRVNMAVHL